MVSASGKWHKGYLVESSTYDCTSSEAKLYPPTFFKPYTKPFTPKAGTPTKPSPFKTPETSSPSTPPKATTLTETIPTVTLVAKADRESTKANQLSFAKGDLVELVDDSDKWYKGILRNSSTCALSFFLSRLHIIMLIYISYVYCI